MLGMAIRVVSTGELTGTYRWETEQEDFLALFGEAVLIVEGQERPLKQWDFVHCPPEGRHAFATPATSRRCSCGRARGQFRRIARGASTAPTGRPPATPRARPTPRRTGRSPTRASRRRVRRDARPAGPRLLPHTSQPSGRFGARGTIRRERSRSSSRAPSPSGRPRTQPPFLLVPIASTPRRTSWVSVDDPEQALVPTLRPAIVGTRRQPRPPAGGRANASD